MSWAQYPIEEVNVRLILLCTFTNCCWGAGHKVAMVDKGFHFPLTLTAGEQIASALAGPFLQLFTFGVFGHLTNYAFGWSHDPGAHAESGCAGVLLSKAGVLPLGRAPSAGVFLLRVLPSVVSFAGTLYLGNLAYLSLSMAFIQMLKAMVPAITLVSRSARCLNSERLYLTP